MSYRKPPGEVQDYTAPFLVVFGVLVFILLWTLSIVLGFIWALASAYAFDKVLSWVNRRRPR